MKNVRAVFMDENTVFVVMIVGVASDMVTTVADQNAFIELAGQPLRDDTSSVARSNDEVIEHYDCNPFVVVVENFSRRERRRKSAAEPGLLVFEPLPVL